MFDFNRVHSCQAMLKLGFVSVWKKIKEIIEILKAVYFVNVYINTNVVLLGD